VVETCGVWAQHRIVTRRRNPTLVVPIVHLRNRHFGDLVVVGFLPSFPPFEGVQVWLKRAEFDPSL